MDDWRRTAHRITKYNPGNRDERGAYKVDEWTSISDIGKEFNGTKFTYEDYISTEDKYIAAIREFCNYFRIDDFEIKNLELHEPQTWDKNSLALKEKYEALRNKKSVSKEEIEIISRLILREYLWCNLVNGDRGIYFGYDYYMYFDAGSKIPVELKIKIEKFGLYAE